MPPKRKRRARRAGRRGLAWACLVLLAAAVGFLGGYLYRQMPSTASAPAVDLRPLRAVVGSLDPRGTRVKVADRAAADEAAHRLRVAAGRVPGAQVQGPGRTFGSSMQLTLQVGQTAFPVEFWWPVSPRTPEPRLVIVIDDLGGSREEAADFLDLPLAITPAVLSNLPHSEQVAGMLRERGREFLLHLPMEPQGYPEMSPGEGALLAAMDEGQLRRALQRNLARVPGASGVNNHMGSRLTELEAPMGWVMDELSARGLYFLDSVTSPHSVAAEVAARAGVRWARRDVFLDNVREDEAVAGQIDKAVALARRNGLAVAIGHPHRVTLDALARRAPAIRAAGVRVVPLGEVLRRGDGA